MLKEIKLPDLGEGIDSADVSEILVSPGDNVSVDDIILVLESEKASMEIPSEDSGVVKNVFVSSGDVVKTGEVLIMLEVAKSPSSKAGKKDVKPEKPPTQKQKPKGELNPAIDLERNTGKEIPDKTFASPGVRRLARELEINLLSVSATGPKGRITKDDLHTFIKQKMAQSGAPIGYKQPEIDFSKWGGVEIKSLTKIQQITGQRLQQSWQTIPHVTQFDETDISVLNSIREEKKAEGVKKNIKVTFLPFIMKAVVKSLREFPVFNSSLDHTQQNLVVKDYINLGIAVDTPTGLVVPVIKNTDKKSVLDLSKDLMDISERARSGKLKPDELKGGTFTISNLGGIGGTHFTPIINPPEVAIMGISKSVWRVIYNHKSKEMVPTLTMPFSLSYDHRVVDGAIGAAFTSFFSKALFNSKTFE